MKKAVPNKTTRTRSGNMKQASSRATPVVHKSSPALPPLLETPADTALFAQQEQLRSAHEDLLRTHLELESSRDRYADLFDFAPVGYINFFRGGRIAEINLTAATMLGRRRATMVHGPFVPYVAREDMRKFLDHLDRCKAATQPLSTELRLVRKDASTFPAQITTAPARNGGAAGGRFRTAIFDLTELRRAQDAVKRQADLLSLTHDSIMVRGMDRRITFWNRGAEEKYGWSSREALGRILHELLKTVFPEPLEEIERKVIRDDRWEGELVHTARDGHKLTVSSRWVLQRDEHGEPEAVLVASTDLSARKRAEAALRQSEAEVRRLVDSNLIGIIFATIAGEITDANDAFLKIVGYTREDMRMGKLRWRDITPPEFRELDERAVREVEQRGAFAPFEKEYIRKDGSRVPILLGGALVDASSGACVCFVLDLTERKRAEAALRASEEQYRTLAEAMPQIVWSANAHGEIEYCNQHFCDLTGLSMEQTMQGKCWDAVHPDDRQVLAEKWDRARKDGDAERFEYRVRRAADGLYRWHLGIVTPVRDAAGAIFKWIGLGTDIHERKVAEEERLRFFNELQAERARLALHYAAVRALASSASLRQAAPKILREICNGIGWDFGALWMVEQNKLRAATIWHRPDFSPAAFIEATRKLALGKDEGLPGRVWAKGKPVWVEDVTKASFIPRRHAARKGGLGAGFGFPIVFRGRMLGMIEFFKREVLGPQKELLQTVAAISSQIGQFIQRTRAEEQVRRANRELEQRVRERTGALRAAYRKLVEENRRRQRLEEQILDITEIERRRFGEDLHDGLCQELSGLALMGKTFAKKLRENNSPDAAHLERWSGILSDMVGRARDLARGLHPIELERTGLVSALKEMAARTDHGVECRFESAGALTIDDDAVALQLYRIAQEAVTNAIKHARAQKIVIRLQLENGRVALRVQDDGVGFSKKTVHHKGMGLQLMHYRASLIGASLRIEGMKRGGTRVTCSVHSRRARSDAY
jgi:PAS domain S-box-containing protein